MKTAKKIPKTAAFRTGVQEVSKSPIKDSYNVRDNDTVEQNEDEDQKILNAFKTFDLNGDGYLSLREFTSMLNSFGDLSPQDIEEIIRESNLEGKMQMNYKQFIEFWKRISSE